MYENYAGQSTGPGETAWTKVMLLCGVLDEDGVRIGRTGVLERP